MVDSFIRPTKFFSSPQTKKRSPSEVQRGKARTSLLKPGGRGKGKAKKAKKERPWGRGEERKGGPTVKN